MFGLGDRSSMPEKDKKQKTEKTVEPAKRVIKAADVVLFAVMLLCALGACWQAIDAFFLGGYDALVETLRQNPDLNSDWCGYLGVLYIGFRIFVYGALAPIALFCIFGIYDSGDMTAGASVLCAFVVLVIANIVGGPGGILVLESIAVFLLEADGSWTIIEGLLGVLLGILGIYLAVAIPFGIIEEL